MQRRLRILRGLVLPAILVLAPRGALAWDYEGHRVVNELALAALPPNAPAFLRTPAARERIAFLSGEPDRWRNISDLPLRNSSGPDHYLDFEELPRYGLTAATLPFLRYDFVALIARERAAHPSRFAPIDPEANLDHTREYPGFVPWAIVEYYDRLKSGFSYLKAFKQGGTPDEIANAQANIIYIMGVMGHFVGDASQPLHTSIHFRGWVGPNPKGYSTDPSIHQLIDGEFFRQTGGLKLETMSGKIQPATRVGRRAEPELLFRDVVKYIYDQHKLLEPLYQLEKSGKFNSEPGKGQEGRAFLEGQLVKAGQMLGDLWFTAWQDAPMDNFLKSRLGQRASPPK